MSYKVLVNNLKRFYCIRNVLPTLTLYSKFESCSLCDEAKDVLVKYKSKFVFKEIDITAVGNEYWFDKYKYDIPVIHINDIEVMRHKVFETLLLEALDQAQKRLTEKS